MISFFLFGGGTKNNKMLPEASANHAGYSKVHQGTLLGDIAPDFSKHGPGEPEDKIGLTKTKIWNVILFN